jgi:hypothetical protein
MLLAQVMGKFQCEILKYEASIGSGYELKVLFLVVCRYGWIDLQIFTHYASMDTFHVI